MSGISHAVFLSYASQDAEAAERIATALRAEGIEVWFDKSELRGGDAWDRSIRQQIRECQLFVPVISAHTDARREGYFRREWKLAVDRTHDMSERVAFLVPVVIDDTSDSQADVPDRFREVQWTRLPSGETSPAFVEGIRRLLSPELAPSRASGAAPAIRQPARAPWRSKAAVLAIAVIAVVAIGYLALDRFVLSKHPIAAAFNPPPHSIAVLPFLNLSGDKEQEYFSDGLTEELLNSLAEINELQVAARTSSFYFKGKDVDLGTVAHKLNVGAILEGSVRRSANTVRITAQLINAVTGFHLWSKTYDRDLGDVLKLQTEIADAVASALKVNLLGDEATKIELGGTRNPTALDAYLRATKTYWAQRNAEDAHAVIDGYTESIRLDPEYALAYAARSLASESIATNWATSVPAIRAAQDAAQADAREAIDLAPKLSEGHLALAVAHQNLLEFSAAGEEFELARSLAPGNARILRNYGAFAVSMGRSESGLASLRRAVVLDPLNSNSHSFLGGALRLLRRYRESVAVYKDAESVRNVPGAFSGSIGLAYYLLGDFASARSSCEKKDLNEHLSEGCLAIAYDRLAQHADAEAMLAKLRASMGDAAAYEYAEIYAQWGNTPEALKWLDAALRLGDLGLIDLKVEPFLDPLRKEPRFQAIERELKFPPQ